MNELEALTTWNKMPKEFRAALLAPLPREGEYQAQAGMLWHQIPEPTKERLLRLDWNFMLGGKLGNHVRGWPGSP